MGTLMSLVLKKVRQNPCCRCYSFAIVVTLNMQMDQTEQILFLRAVSFLTELNILATLPSNWGSWEFGGVVGGWGRSQY